MYRVTKMIDFCYGHRLLGGGGKCCHLHGHNGRLEIELETDQLDEQGMVRDFSEVKMVVTRWLDECLDHRMILCRRDPLIDVLRAHGEPVFVMDGNPTAEGIAELVFGLLRGQGLPVREVRLWETPSSFATFGVGPPTGSVAPR
jgi:6-pyruvoyltetrahydropterin/6-carboxytetrahydropterin synthase